MKTITITKPFVITIRRPRPKPPVREQTIKQIARDTYKRIWGDTIDKFIATTCKR